MSYYHDCCDVIDCCLKTLLFKKLPLNSILQTGVVFTREVIRANPKAKVQYKTIRPGIWYTKVDNPTYNATNNP